MNIFSIKNGIFFWLLCLYTNLAANNELLIQEYEKLTQELTKVTTQHEREALEKKRSHIEDLLAGVPTKPATAPVDAIKILEQKIEMVFNNFISLKDLGHDDAQKADYLKFYFKQKVTQAANNDTAKKEIILFVEIARTMFYKIQLLRCSAETIKSVFGTTLSTLRVNKKQCNLMLTTLLHDAVFSNHAWQPMVEALAPYQTLPIIALAARRTSKNFTKQALLKKISKDGLLTPNTWATTLKNSFCLKTNLERVIDVFFTQRTLNLLQKYFDVEQEIERFATLDNSTQKTVAKAIYDHCDKLILELFEMSKESDPATAQWLQLFIVRTMALKKEIPVRQFINTEPDQQQSYRKARTNQEALTLDPCYEILKAEPELHHYVNTYESLVRRFLTGDITSKVQFSDECELFLIDLRSTITKLSPGFFFSKHLSEHVPMLKTLSTHIAEIKNTIEQDKSLLNATQNLIINLFGETGLLKNISSNEAGLGINLSNDAIKQIFSNNDTAKEAIIQLIAKITPELARKALAHASVG